MLVSFLSCTEANRVSEWRQLLTSANPTAEGVGSFPLSEANTSKTDGSSLSAGKAVMPYLWLCAPTQSHPAVDRHLLPTYRITEHWGWKEPPGSSSPSSAQAKSPQAHYSGLCVQMALEYLQGRRLHSLSGQTIPMLSHPVKKFCSGRASCILVYACSLHCTIEKGLAPSSWYPAFFLPPSLSSLEILLYTYQIGWLSMISL